MKDITGSCRLSAEAPHQSSRSHEDSDRDTTSGVQPGVAGRESSKW